MEGWGGGEGEGEGRGKAKALKEKYGAKLIFPEGERGEGARGGGGHGWFLETHMTLM